MRHIAILIVLLLVTLIVIANKEVEYEIFKATKEFFEGTLEGFTTKREKATTIMDWFKKNPNSEYAKYKEDLNHQSNIVEYNDILNLLHSNPRTSIDDIEKII